ncbi:MAG: hypothetical protein P4L27_00625 [Ignavibacteriaceae bacterium]|nr:hypothetical protein [Ignavibacteriaceae bacterium]
MESKNSQKRKTFLINGIRNYIYLSLLIIVPLLLNWKVTSYEFTQLDDTEIIGNNYNFLGDFRNILQAFKKDNFLSKDGKNYYRPVQTVTFMIDAHISRENPQPYHISNLLYHILTVIALFFLLKKLDIKDEISFFLSILFSVHPLFTNAVAWIPGRGDLLAGLFGVVSLISFINYNNRMSYLHFSVHCCAFLLALFSKEISAFIPIIMVFYYWFVLNNKYKIKELVPFIIFWGLSFSGYLLLRNTYLHYQNVASVKAFISNLPIIPIFLSKLIIPLGLSSMPTYGVISVCLGIILFIGAGVFILKLKIENKPFIMLGILWFIGFIIPAMFVYLSFKMLHFEYLECRAYLPSIGIFIAAGILLNETIRKNGLKILSVSFILIILAFSAIAYNYSGDYSDPITFFTSLIKLDPSNAYAFSERGSTYLAKNKLDLALSDFDHSIEISPTYSDPYFNKGVLYNALDDHIQAEHFYSDALKYDTLYPESNNLNEYAYINFSTEMLDLKKYNEIIELLKNGIRKYPTNCSLHNNLGLAYYSKGKFDSAFYEYNRAIESENSYYSYYNNRGNAEFHLMDYKSALKDFNKTIELKADFQDPWGSRGMTKIELGDYEGAVSDLTRAISFNPGMGAAYYFRGVAYIKLNKINEAKTDWQNALNYGYKIAADQLNLLHKK